MGFGGGGGGSNNVPAHFHNNIVNNGGALKANQSTVTGTGITFNSGSEVPIEALI
tara:strand:- start:149 stop:313 length:165 start_codon:yes stop_codon:yes gene_type:complete